MRSTRPWNPWRHRRLLAVLGVAAVAAAALAGSRPAGAGAVGPDVTVIYLNGVSNYGAVGGVRAYSLGTTSCNVGDQPLNWCNDGGDAGCGAGTSDEDHPVIAQNLYRLKDGRFEQIGMSWLKHGFLSTNSFDPACGSCQSPPLGSDQLGVGCTDAYGPTLNGSRPLGMRSEVDPATGVFPYPYTSVPSADVTSQRIRVLESDVDPALNPGALYWMEGQYVAPDDAAAGNAFNNASYQPVTVSGATFNLNLTGSTVRELPAIAAWAAADAGVELVAVDVSGTAPLERFHVARKVTDLGGGNWHYEYAVHNHNSARAARWFTVAFHGGATISNVGFHDIDHHSGEPYATADWSIDLATPSAVTWSTDDFATDPDANAMRWATMFSFWFDADAGPGAMAPHTLGLFTPGAPGEVAFTIPSSLFADGFESGDTAAWSATVGK